jgi:hypothetical protein
MIEQVIEDTLVGGFGAAEIETGMGLASAAVSGGWSVDPGERELEG